MVKEPVAGRVKTRLGRDIGMTSAAWWYRHQVRRTLRELCDPRWRLLLSVTPDRALKSRVFPPLPRIAQGRGDLGRRMIRSLRDTSGPALLVGSDIPGVNGAHVAAAFRQLATHDAVFGPATDGGFWLIGLRHPQSVPEQHLDAIEWSAPDTLRQTLDRFPLAALADTLSDVDSAADLVKRP